jgi:16S rRNA (cytosine1402-N4)-methyltransferase
MARVFRQYGEIPRAGALAGAIDRERRRVPIRTTVDLAESLRRQLKRVPPDLLSRLYQSIRIEVNDELGELERGLEAAKSVLSQGGRLAVIAYHSLEDRIVKRTFLPPPASRHAPPREEGAWTPVVRRAIRPTEDEVERNHRARSARLRVATLRIA